MIVQLYLIKKKEKKSLQCSVHLTDAGGRGWEGRGGGSETALTANVLKEDYETQKVKLAKNITLPK